MDLENTVVKFKTYLDKMNAFNQASNLFEWDMSTDAPKGGTASRAKFMSIISAEAFSMEVSDEMKAFIDELEQNVDKLDEITKAMVYICKKNYNAFKKVPVEEMQKYSELTAIAGETWEEARNKKDYSIFAETLNKIIQYQIKFIDYRGYTGHRYNTLLEDYEPGMTVEKLDLFFAEMKATIVPLLKKVNNAKKKIDTSFLNIKVSKDKQIELSNLLMERLGYDLNRGMLKESVHPFTNGLSRNDVRITTHYHENAFLSSFFAVLHECGHAIYEQNSMESIGDTILDTGVSMGVHESQSRFYENVIGRSYEFWESIYKEVMDILGEDFAHVTITQFYEAANVVKPSLIRIEADELTYSLHVMVRYEIEKILISGDYDVNKLPELWNKKMQEYLGVTPEDNNQGILQDVHWSAGLFGYFPSYSLGNAYAAQILHFMSKDINVFECIRNKEIDVITKWLTEKIHQYGSIKMPNEIIKNISGEELNPKYYVDYLNNKYTKLYELE